MSSLVIILIVTSICCICCCIISCCSISSGAAALIGISAQPPDNNQGTNNQGTDNQPPAFPPPAPGQFPRYIKAQGPVWYNSTPTGSAINAMTTDQSGVIKIIVNGDLLTFRARVQDATGSNDFESTWKADDAVQNKTYKIEYSPTLGVKSTEV